MKIDLNTSLKNNIHENSLTKMKLYEFIDQCVSNTSNDFDEKSNDAIIDFLECIKDYAPADIDLEEEPDPIYEDDEE